MRHLSVFALFVGLAFAVGGGQSESDHAAAPRPGGTTDADPVDLATGLYLRRTTDFVVQDVVPIWFRRVYLSGDTRSLAFGVGTTHSYDYYLTGNLSAITVITDERSRIPYRRMDGGTEREGSLFEHWTTRSEFFGSALGWVGDRWGLGFADGRGFFFRSCGTQANPNGRCTLIGIQDAAGNHLTLIRDEQGRLVKIETPNRRWLRLEYDLLGRIARGWDSTGREMHYEYDDHGRLTRVVDSDRRIRVYHYDERALLRRMEDRPGVVVQNEYDGDGRTTRQVITYAPEARGSAPPPADVYDFRYVVGGGRITETEVLRPGGVRRRLTFDTSGYALSDAWMYPDRTSRTIAYVVDPATNQVSSVQVSCLDAFGVVTSLRAWVALGGASRVTRFLAAQCGVPYFGDDGSP